MQRKQKNSSLSGLKGIYSDVSKFPPANIYLLSHLNDSLQPEHHIEVLPRSASKDGEIYSIHAPTVNRASVPLAPSAWRGRTLLFPRVAKETY
jgi:hypothetical protein